MNTVSPSAKILPFPLRIPLSQQVRDFVLNEVSGQLQVVADYSDLEAQVLAELSRPAHTDP